MKRFALSRAVLAFAAAAAITASLQAIGADKKLTLPDCNKAKEVMECVLIEKWEFFKTGDKNRDGFIDHAEFMAHPVYKEAGYDLKTKTFIFWMVDDNKDGKISLQEWFNNELGQFQMGDKNHDGLIDDKEYADLLKIQDKLFKDAKLGGQ